MFNESKSESWINTETEVDQPPTTPEGSTSETDAVVIQYITLALQKTKETCQLWSHALHAEQFNLMNSVHVHIH